MKNIRQDIITQLSACNSNGYLDELKRCMHISREEGENLEYWLNGCIRSLFFKPNTNILVLCGEQGCGKTSFLRKLLPESLKSYYSEIHDTRMVNVFHDYFILNFEYGGLIGKNEVKHMVSCSTKVMFRSGTNEDGFPVGDKRLSSLVTTTNRWRYPEGRRTFVLDISNLDIEAYNAIDKQALWCEIFYKFAQ